LCTPGIFTLNEENKNSDQFSVVSYVLGKWNKFQIYLIRHHSTWPIYSYEYSVLTELHSMGNALKAAISGNG
jgi:hypothetical protein